MQKIKKITSILLVAIMLSGLCIFSASAQVVGYNNFYFEINSNTNEATLVEYRGDATTTQINIPAVVNSFSVTKIADNVFLNNTVLQSVSLPNTLTSIGNQVFRGCTSLSIAYVPASVTSMGTSVFFGCTSLKKVTLNCNIAELPSDSFGDCKALTTLIVNDSIVSIGARAFKNCTSLAEIPVPSNATVINDVCYYNTAVTELELPTTVTQINRYAFANCTNLQSIIIPKSVTAIDSTAFSNSSNVVIHGFIDSYAQQFAESKNIPFVIIPEYAMGDVNLDDNVDVEDATLIQRYLSEMATLSLQAKYVADYNGDGYVTVADATAIQYSIVLI